MLVTRYDFKIFFTDIILVIFLTFLMTLSQCGGSAPEEDPDNQMQEEPTDSDGDGIADKDDNCPDDVNLNQADKDEDGIGDICDPIDDSIPNTGRCEIGIVECDSEDECDQSEKCNVEGCCETRQSYSCDDENANTYLTCSFLSYAGQVFGLENLDCKSFGLEGTCSGQPTGQGCCGLNACSKNLGIVGGGALECETYSSNGPIGIAFGSTSCENFGQSFNTSASCQILSDPDGDYPDQNCCVFDCPSGVKCPDIDNAAGPFDPNDFEINSQICVDMIHQTSVCEGNTGCCTVACDGDPSRDCSVDGVCPEGEVCGLEGCCLYNCAPEIAGNCAFGSPTTCGGNPELCVHGVFNGNLEAPTTCCRDP